VEPCLPDGVSVLSFSRIPSGRLRSAGLLASILLLMSAPSVVGQMQAGRSTSSAGLVAEAPLQLRPGDAVRITVWRQPEFSGEFRIAGDGTIRHPLYRDVVVVGVPMAEVESRVRTYLLRWETDPQFVLEPLLQVVVSGEVRQPRLYALEPEVTVGQAVAAAGGPTDRGLASRVMLMRNGQVISLDLSRPLNGSTEISVQSGDQIIVPRRRSVLRETIAPIASIAAATASIVNVILRYW
jgi:protein involved in polysaccharide export with SLBB domain